ncbi:MAG: PASTA domain-containing protein [Coriobacteriales bacterium]|nr:PASTA domain-containing protein [Coriobacteriales bacterium]
MIGLKSKVALILMLCAGALFAGMAGQAFGAVVPDVSGSTYVTAADALEDADLQVKTVREDGNSVAILVATNWMVVDQNPKAGTEVEDESVVTLTVRKATDEENKQAINEKNTLMYGEFHMSMLDTMTLDELIKLRDEVNARISQMQASAEASGGPAVIDASNYIGQTVRFDGFVIGLYDVYTTVQDYSGTLYIRVPLALGNENDKTDSINMFYVSYFGSHGTEIDIPYFSFDDEISTFGDLRPGAATEVAAYLKYDGDGMYYITFDNWSETAEIAVPVSING